MTDDEDHIDPEGDPDFIAIDGPSQPMTPGAGSAWAGAIGAPPPVLKPSKATSLEEDDDGSAIPHAALWSMKYHRHFHLFDRTDEHIRGRFGTGDHAFYVIDDGRKHCMISRIVGASPDGTTYCLVARITIDSYERLTNEATTRDGVFADAHEFAVCGVFEPEVEDAPANVTVAEEYAAIGDVPPEYLGPHPFIEFSDNLDGEW